MYRNQGEIPHGLNIWRGHSVRDGVSGISRDDLGLTDTLTMQGRLNDDSVLSVLSPHSDWWDGWDKKVCRNVSQGEHCNLARAARTSFLSSWSGDSFSLRHLHSRTGQVAPSALTACITSNLAVALRKSFDVDHDSALSLAEKSSLLTTLGVSPGLAVLRLAGQVGLTSLLPRYIGCCGRLAVYEGGLTRLEDEVRRDWSTRAELAGQLLSLLENFLSVEGWVMLAWDLTWQDFSLSRSGQLVFTGLEKLTPVDKVLLEPPPQEDRAVCNSDCFSKFQKDVMMRTPRGQPGLGCGAALQYADLMYRDVCTNIFSDQEDRLGLLHSAPSEEVSRLVKECAVEEGRGGRWRALDDLREVLSESEDEEREETSTESSTEDYSGSGNNTELDSGESGETGEYDTTDT